MTETSGERITGVLGLVVSTLYVLQARTIEDSLLADAVGASGVPVGVGALMFFASLALIVKTFLRGRPVAPAASQQPAEATQAPASKTRGHWLAAGLLLILVGYTVFLPTGGYLLSVVLLLVASAWFGGARGAATLLITAVAGGLVLWFLFSFALKVGMPPGVLPRLLGF